MDALASVLEREEHSFKGAVYGTITIEFGGKKVTRKVRIGYEHTPEWPHIAVVDDVMELREDEAESYRFNCEVQADPMDTIWIRDEERPPYWVKINFLYEDGILGRDVDLKIEKLIEAQCRIMDAKRRKKWKGPKCKS